MKNLLLAFLLFLAGSEIHAQISGSSATLAVTPATATVIDSTITVGGTVSLTNATVQIAANYYAGDVLAYNTALATTYGITGSYSVSSGVSGILSFTGTTTPANWQALFRTVTYQNTAASCGPSSRTIIFNQGNYLYNSYSQHFYQYVPTSLIWTAAKTAAAASSYNGMQGYLATITSAGENNFVWKLLAADAWIGGSDDYNQINAATGTTTYANQTAANGNEYWVTGPEAGTKFSTGLSTPVSYNGAYVNWNAGEPNNSGGVEYYTEFYSSGSSGGKWNDLPITSSLPYVVEYGGMPNDIPQNNNFSKQLVLTSTTGGDITGGNVSVCSGTNSTVLTSTAGVAGVTIIRWESSLDNFLTTATTINNTSATYTVTNLTQTTYFRSVASGNSCSSSPSSVTKITVGNSVAGTISADNTTICNGSSSNLSLAGNVGNILKWQSSTDNVNWTDIANTKALYTTPALSAGTYYYRAQVQNTGCTTIAITNAITITVTSGSNSVGGSLTGASFCSSTNSATLTLTGYTGTIQNWQSSTDGGVTWATIANTTATNAISNIATTTLYRVSVKNASCNAVYSSTGTVTVGSLPVVAAIAGTATVCAGSTTALSDATASGVWSSGNTLVATVNSSGVVTGISGGTAVITYTVTNGSCSTSVTKTVTVYAAPVVAAISGISSICTGSVNLFSDATGGGVWSSSNTAAASISTGGIVTANTAGATTISYTVTNGNGCSTAVTQAVTVNAVPVVPAISGPASVCVGKTIALSDATSGGVWSSLNNSVATVDVNGNVTGVSAGSVSIIYTITNGSGCSSSSSQVVTVNALPVVAAITGSSTVCQNTTITLADATPLGVWASDNTSSATVSGGIVTGVSAGTANISYTVTNVNGCVTTVNKAITITGAPVVAPVTGPSSVCAGSSILLSESTASGVWSSSNTSVASVDVNGNITGKSAGVSNISYTVSNGNGCSTAVTQAVTVNALPVVAAITGNSSICMGSTGTLSDITAAGVWSTSNGSIATVDQNGVVTAVSAGSCTISYTVTNGSGCSTTVVDPVTINPLPVVASITGNTSVCVASSSALSDATASGVWSSDNTSVATVDMNGVVTGVSGGTANISYTVTNGSGCSTTVIQSVNINNVPVVSAITGPATVCATSTIPLADATPSGVWSSDNTSVATVDMNGVVTGVSGGTANISYTITSGSGCTSTVTQSITVNSLPTVSAISGSSPVCVGSTTTLSDATASGVWSSDNTAVATVDMNGVVTAVSGGTANISYTVTNGSGCTSTVAQSITVNSLPTVSAISGSSSVCVGSTTALSDATASGVWSSDNTGVATVDMNGVVTGVSGGTANISYTLTNGSGCTNTVTQSITVNSLPTVSAISGSIPVCVGSTMTLSDATASGVWSSDNTSVATVDINGVVTGVSGGTANISYTVTNGSGCPAAVTQGITVNGLPVVPAIRGTAALCTSSTTSLSDTASGGVWSSDNTAVATVDGSGIVSGLSSGTANISYSVTNQAGCITVASEAVTVNSVLAVPAITGTANVCTGSTTSLSDALTGGTWSSDNTGVATVDVNGVVSGLSAGTATISYQVTNGSGCSNTVTQGITVNATPVVSPISSAARSVQTGSQLTLSDTTASGVWSSSNTGVATIDGNGVVSGVSIGTTLISYTVSNGSGCSSTATLSVQVTDVVVIPPAPSVVDSVYYVGNPQNPATVSGQVEGISGSTLNFYSSATGGSASSTAPVLPTQPGTYSYWVSQTVNGEEGPRVMFKVVIATEDVLVPKVFTPNGDGFNDVIKPVTPGIQSFHYFRIYNRWGNLVYSSTDPNQGWDGTFNGKPQPKETYLWMIEAVDLNGVTKKYSGMITLFR